MISAVLAPILAELAKNGLSLLGDAILAKGKDLVESTLGVNIEESLRTEEGIIRLKELELQHEEFLIESVQRQKEQELKEQEMAYKDTASARDMNARIQGAAAASTMAKNVAYWLDIFAVVATFGMAYFLIFFTIPVDNKELLYTAFGSLLTVCMTIINFHRGTSARSSMKDDSILNLINRNNKDLKES